MKKPKTLVALCATKPSEVKISWGTTRTWSMKTLDIFLAWFVTKNLGISHIWASHVNGVRETSVVWFASDHFNIKKIWWSTNKRCMKKLLLMGDRIAQMASILAPHRAAPGSNYHIPMNFSLDVAEIYWPHSFEQLTKTWWCQSNPSSGGEWQASTA